MKCMIKYGFMTLVSVVSFASSSFALDAAYWLRGATDWGDFGVAENWAIGSAESEVHKVPEMTEYIHLDGHRKFDLNGGTYTVGGLSTSATGAGGNQCYSTWVTNGTLTVDGYVLTTSRLEAFDGGTLVLKAADTGRSWGHGNGFFITVHNGGAVEERKALTFQKYQVTIEEGGSFVLDPTEYGPHPTGLIASWYKNNGYMYLPHGIKRNYSWDDPVKTPASETFYQYAGTMKIGGPVAKGKQAGQPMYFEFHGGTLEAENAVTFANDINGVKFMEGSAMTVKVDADSSLDLKNVTFADDATVTKTGPGKLILRDAEVSALAVSEGVVEIQSDSVAPATVSFAADTTLRLTVSGFRLDTVTAYDGMAFELDPSVLVAGAGVLYSSDADFLAYAKDVIAEVLPDEFGAAIVGDRIQLTKASDYMFDASKSSDLSNPNAWKGGIVPVGEDVIVGGAGTVTFAADAPAFKSITVQLGATLSVEGGTLEAPVDLPKLTLNYEARLLIATDAVAQLTNEFTTAGDAQTLPVFEVATNATVLVQTPGELPCKTYDGGSRKDWGFRLKNVALRWYGNLQMALEDTANKTGYESRLTLGYAAAGETSYIAVDCRGGTWTASGEGNYAARCRTPLVIVFPDAGGTVVPVGTLLFRDFKRVNRVSSDGLQSYACPGMLIGANEKTSNPPSVGFDVIFDGTTELAMKGANIIGGGAHVRLAGPAKWSYTNKAWNDDTLIRYLRVYQLGSIEVTDGAYLETVPTSNTRGIRLNGDAQDSPALAVRDASISTLSWSGSGKAVGEFDGATLKIGVQRYKASETLANRTAVFAGLKEAQLGADGLTVVAADVWREKDHTSAEKDVNWMREVTMGVPLTGIGGLSVSNELPTAATVPGMTVFVTSGANTATGAARACETVTGPANLVFADGANWAGTVVANAGLSLTNLTDGAAAATVSFGSVSGAMPIRVWKTGGVIEANDKVNVSGTAAAFEFVAMDEKLAAGDVVELGLYPENAALPANTRHVEYSSVASETPGFVTLCAKQVSPGLILLLR